MSLIRQLLVVLIAYALGCIAVGYYLVRWRMGEDLRTVGSGATGGRNAKRVLGTSGAIATGVGDILKGVIAMLIALWFKVEPWAIASVMVAVLLGHIFPIQLGFKGGKGLSAAFGGVLVYDYRIALITAGIALLMLAINRKRRAFLFLMGIACAPLVAYFLGQRWEIVIGATVMVAIILYAHRENLRESWNLQSD